MLSAMAATGLALSPLVSTDVAEIVFAPCGAVRHLNVNAEVRAFTNSSNHPAFVSMDSPDDRVNTRYQFAWKRC